MDVTRNRLILLATLGSVGLLGGAFAFQYIGGLAPCKLCLTARWPHAAAIVIGLLALSLGWRFLPWLGALAAAATSGVGIYHTGIERHWWQGPTSCSSGPIDQIDASALLDQILAAPIVRCDEVAWALGGISMASWNAILSAGLALIWIWAARKA